VNNKVCVTVNICVAKLMLSLAPCQKIEIAVKQIVSGSTLEPSGTVVNPEAFKQYYRYVELEKLVGETKRRPRARL
jgi:hypothetical protein